ncbi:MAG: BlaI/MecI/CopY family transcriptional regulator [Nonlabens sp.]
MKTLTQAEEEIMQYLWQLKEASVSQIIDLYQGHKPAYNTVSTIIRILETKNFVGHHKVGRGHIYYPLVEKDVYSKASAQKLAGNYFQGSFKSMVSFFMTQEDLSVSDLEDILKELKEKR